MAGCSLRALSIGRISCPDELLAGPAVITQYDTTTFVPSGYSVTSDHYGNLIAEASHDR